MSEALRSPHPNLLAPPDQVVAAASKIRNFLATHKPQHHSYPPLVGESYRYMASLSTPRTFGERTANYLQVVQPIDPKDDIVYFVTYQQGNSFPYKETGVSQEFPLRVVALRAESSSTYTFDGSLDARDYPLQQHMVDELIEDLETSS